MEIKQDHLEKLKQRWIDEPDKRERDAFYARELGPVFAPIFRKKSLGGSYSTDRAWRPAAMVAVLGLSWQPAALMAAWAQPEHLLLVGTDESFSQTIAGEGVRACIARVAGMAAHRIEETRVLPDNEVELYEAIKKFAARRKIVPANLLIDITGGKKSMAVAAAMAGHVLGARLTYVDYTEYLPDGRTPMATTEYPRLLANPLEVMGDLKLDRVRAWFNEGHYAAARDEATLLARSLLASRESEIYAELAAGYGAWDRFEFNEAYKAISKATDLVNQFGEKVAHGVSLQHQLSRHGAILKELSRIERYLNGRERAPGSLEDGFLLVKNHVAALGRALNQKKTSIALMLLYSSVERYVDAWLSIEFRLDLKRPNYHALGYSQERYAKLARAAFGPDAETVPRNGGVMYWGGILMLATLREDLIDGADFGVLKNLGAARNLCEFEHGFVAPRTKDGEIRTWVESATKLFKRAPGFAEAGGPLEHWEFPRLVKS